MIPITCGGPKLAEWKKNPVTLVAIVEKINRAFQPRSQLPNNIAPMVTNPVKSPTRLIRTWRNVKVEVESPKIMIVSLSLCPGVARTMFIKMQSFG